MGDKAAATKVGGLELFRQADENKRGIPEAIFIENVEEMCKTREPNDVLAALQELYSKYQYMQSSLSAQRSGLKAKLPDIVSALECVNHLLSRRDKAPDDTQEFTYQLSENIWSKASVAPTNAVCLWLGANVMLEYTLDEAAELLRTNEANAKTTIGNLDEDMAFLRDQLTTTEVNIARTHNFNVKLRAKAKEEAEAKEAKAPATAPAPAVAAASVPMAAIVQTAKAPGSDTEYTWKQESEEIEVSMPVPEGASKEDIKVKILADKLSISHKGKVILEGDLAGRCSPGGSTWTMNSGKVEVTLEKAEATRWPSLLSVEA